ncbi:hypothetical protein OG884_26530 [Streptosporangium sp. NBC_01755]|uniref:phage tail fiber protein n=1 Tax=Streptosporangium sp. NBC_01755 TaxID=2975949 RepID=UPI002DD938EF|nr:hypothetical protein [Streptosporangium sp. NBC_01755]WSC98406.1 hypothetical protein OG884_26530 [Streptosporangium sp. NBC_01755]
MAEGLSSGTANAILNALCRSTPWTEPDEVWVQLHTAAPGAAGTDAAATEADRIQATFGTNASSGAISNTATLTWSSVAGAEDYTHFSAWSASTSGTFLFSGTMTANAVMIGDDFVIPIGDLDVSLNIAS